MTPWDEDQDDEYDDEEREAILAANVGLYVYPQKVPDEDAFDAFRYDVKAFFRPNSHAHVFPDTAVMIASGANHRGLFRRERTPRRRHRERARALA